MKKDGYPLPRCTPSGVSASGYGQELLAAKEWGIDPDQWFAKSRAARAAMMATCAAEAMINEAVTPKDKTNGS